MPVSSARTSWKKDAGLVARCAERFKDAFSDVHIVELQGTVGAGPAIDREKASKKSSPRIRI